MIDFSIEPLVHFERLIDNAQKKGVREYQSMTLATNSAKNKPSARVVYYKGIHRGGLSFYCNYLSDKSREIEAHPSVCVNFFWMELMQQVRIMGETQKLSREENEKYFSTRPRDSQLGAWASQQSEVISSYGLLVQKMKEMEKKFEGQEIPCPDSWGGYIIIPTYYEFWFGKEGRLHERYCYEKQVLSSKPSWVTYMKCP